MVRIYDSTRTGHLINHCSIPSVLRQVAVLLCVFSACCAQVFELDENFNPQFRDESVTPGFFAAREGGLWVTQVDFIDGVRTEGLHRYCADGTRLNSLQIIDPQTGERVTRPDQILETDLGTILVSSGHILRVGFSNALDPNFTPPRLWSGKINAVYSLPGNRLLIAGANEFIDASGIRFKRQAALKIDAIGTHDPSFPDFPGKVKNVDNLGRIYVFHEHNLVRLNADGLTDDSWSRVRFELDIFSVDLNPQGGVLVISRESDNPWNSITKISETGEVDQNFHVPNEVLSENLRSFEAPKIKALSNGSILVLSPNLVRLDSSGGVDSTFQALTDTIRGVATWGEQPLTIYRDESQRPRFAGKLNSAGAIDPNWKPAFGRFGKVRAVRTDRQGRVVVVGFFDHVDDKPAQNAVRFLGGGKIDPSFQIAAIPETVTLPNDWSVPGYDDIRFGLDHSIFLRHKNRQDYPTSPPSFRWYRFQPDGTRHPQSVPEIVGGHCVSASADGSLYYTHPYAQPITSGENYGKTIFGSHLSKIPSGETEPQRVALEFTESLNGPSAYIFSNYGAPGFEFLTDGRMLINSGLASAAGLGGVVSLTNSTITPMPVRLNGNQQIRFPFFGQHSEPRFGTYGSSSMVRINEPGELDPNFRTDWRVGTFTFETLDRQNRPIVHWINNDQTVGRFIRLHEDGSLDPGFNIPDLFQEYTATFIGVADDNSIYVARNKFGQAWLDRLIPSTISQISTTVTTDSVVAGRYFGIFASASNEDGVAWQWEHNDKIIAGETGPNFVRPNAATSDSGYYRAIAMIDGKTIKSVAHKIEVTPSSARISNLSARAQVSLDDARQVAGFVLSEPASVLVRSIGPGLAQFGVPSPLSNPEIVVHQGLQEVARNQNWGDDPTLTDIFCRVGAFPLSPQSSDAAMHLTLNEGVYTATISDPSSEGIGLVEIYLDDRSSHQPLRNFSVRALSAAGEGQLVAGFVVEGEGPQPLLIRVIGSELIRFGVENVMSLPSLSLEDSRGSALNFDSISTAARSAATRVGAFPIKNESGNVATLIYMEPGVYTASVSGPPGVALLELYALPND